MIQKLNIALDNMEPFLETASQLKRLQEIQDVANDLEKKGAGIMYYLRKLQSDKQLSGCPDDVLESLVKGLERHE